MIAMDKAMAVKDVVYKLQLYLLEGIRNNDQLFAAGSILSQADYQDAVTERSIVNLCGYPLCRNSLPAERPRKGRYRISLKEHKVYDLHETYMYCSTECVVSSRAFAGSLQEERVSTLNPRKVREVLRLFEDVNLEKSGMEESLGEDGDLGLSKMKIHENVDIKSGEVSLEDWIGPSNAIEGYVPKGDRKFKPPPKRGQQGSKSKPSGKNDFSFNEMDFMSTIITSDEYSISKTSANPNDNTYSAKQNESNTDSSSKLLGLQEQITALNTSSEMKGESKVNFRNNELGTSSSNRIGACDTASSSNSYQTVEAEKASQGKTASKPSTMLKSSLKPSGSKKYNRNVTWADKKANSTGSGDLCEFSELQDMKEGSGLEGDGDSFLRYKSAEACAAALSKAAEAVASGDCDGSDPVAEAGIVILPSSYDVDGGESTEDVHTREPDSSSSDVDGGESTGDVHTHEPDSPSSDVDGGESTEDVHTHEPDSATLKWPTKPGSAHSDLLDSEDSWFDEPPEGFSLTLSPFATMWMALFAWISSSSLAYIYGRDERFHEEYLSINGREYPQKITLGDGRSSEIKQTLAGCLSRALPGLVAEIRLPIPISTLEQGMARLLDTMSFTDAIPALRMKQWHVIVLLFIEALSICRMPAITPHLTNRRPLIHKVLNGAKISAEEYEIMTDFIIPLGRAPQFSSRSGA